MKTKKLPTLEYLNECFVLDETSPSGLRWKVRPVYHFKSPVSKRWNTRYSGQPAGSVRANKCGRQYFQVEIADINNLVHRIVYSMFNEIELSTELVVDHIDGNSLNNVPINLRSATNGENSCNSKTPKTNTSGTKGVFFDTPKQLWFGKVYLNKKQYYTKFSKSKEVALGLIQELREKLHKDFCHHGE